MVIHRYLFCQPKQILVRTRKETMFSTEQMILLISHFKRLAKITCTIVQRRPHNVSMSCSPGRDVSSSTLSQMISDIHVPYTVAVRGIPVPDLNGLMSSIGRAWATLGILIGTECRSPGEHHWSRTWLNSRGQRPRVPGKYRGLMRSGRGWWLEKNLTDATPTQANT